MALQAHLVELELQAQSSRRKRIARSARAPVYRRSPHRRTQASKTDGQGRNQRLKNGASDNGALINGCTDQRTINHSIDIAVYVTAFA